MQTTIETLHPILEADTELFLYLNNLGNEKFDSFWLWVTNKETWYPFYAVLLLWVFIQFNHWRKIALFILVTAAMVAFVDQTTSGFFKPFVGRFRPCHQEYLDGLMRLVKGSCGGKYSFFSGHSSNSFAVAVYLGMMLRKFKPVIGVMLVWACVVAYSRVYVGVHYPLDIVTGALWGSLFGYVFYAIYKRVEGLV